MEDKVNDQKFSILLENKRNNTLSMRKRERRRGENKIL